MTANGTAGGSMSPISGLMTLLHKAGRLVRRVLLGGLFVIAAGIVAVATAILGVLVAIAALVLRMRVSRQGPSRQSTQTRQSTSTSEQTPVTLEARQTGEGWTVE